MMYTPKTNQIAWMFMQLSEAIDWPVIDRLYELILN